MTVEQSSAAENLWGSKLSEKSPKNNLHRGFKTALEDTVCEMENYRCLYDVSCSGYHDKQKNQIKIK